MCKLAKTNVFSSFCISRIPLVDYQPITAQNCSLSFPTSRIAAGWANCGSSFATNADVYRKVNLKWWSLFYEGAIKNHDKKEKLWKTRSPFTEFKSISSVAFPRTEKLQSGWHQNPRRMIFLPTFNQNLSWYPKPLTCFHNFFERLRFSPCAMTCPSTIDFTYNRFHSRCIFEGVRTQGRKAIAPNSPNWGALGYRKFPKLSPSTYKPLQTV